MIRYLFDRDVGVADHLIARWLFLRTVGLIFFSAFFALLFQIRGLIALMVCFVCFLSFIGVSQDFGQYQSDGMLLEAGFLALCIRDPKRLQHRHRPIRQRSPRPEHLNCLRDRHIPYPRQINRSHRDAPNSHRVQPQAYGLFATMTPHRYENEFEGSNDGRSWTPYLFRYKPQDLRERPRIYAPYQPRFDWNLWFASLTTWQDAPIVPLAEERLLENDADVLALFRGNPFPRRPPRYVRAVLWQYWFSTAADKRAQGVWWRREYLGTYAPTVEHLPDGRFVMVEQPTLQGPAGS